MSIYDRRYLGIFFAFVLLFFIEPLNALAYIDPGSGSLLVQMLIASAVGLTVIVRTSWGRVKLFLAQVGKKQSKIPENTEIVDDKG